MIAASMVPASKNPFESQFFIFSSYFFMPLDMSMCMPMWS